MSTVDTQHWSICPFPPPPPPQVGVVDSPPRVFNSPYGSALSLDYNPVNRMSEFKVQNFYLNSNKKKVFFFKFKILKCFEFYCFYWILLFLLFKIKVNSMRWLKVHTCSSGAGRTVFSHLRAQPLHSQHQSVGTFLHPSEPSDPNEPFRTVASALLHLWHSAEEKNRDQQSC